MKGKKGDITDMRGGRIVPVDVKYASSSEKSLDEELYRLSFTLSI
jgi:hypothetical protein